MRFLPVSQSEGPTKFPDVCALVEMDLGLMVSGSSLKIISVFPRASVCRNKKGPGSALLGGPWMR